MHISKSIPLPNGNLLNLVDVAGTGGGRKWGIWRNVYVVETQGPFAGSRRKNVAKIHASDEYDARSNKATDAALKFAEEVFERELAKAKNVVHTSVTQ